MKKLLILLMMSAFLFSCEKTDELQSEIDRYEANGEVVLKVSVADAGEHDIYLYQAMSDGCLHRLEGNDFYLDHIIYEKDKKIVVKLNKKTYNLYYSKTAPTTSATLNGSSLYLKNKRDEYIGRLIREKDSITINLNDLK